MVSSAGVRVLAVSVSASDSSLVHVYIIYIYGTCALHAFL